MSYRNRTRVPSAKPHPGHGFNQPGSSVSYDKGNGNLLNAGISDVFSIGRMRTV